LLLKIIALFLKKRAILSNRLLKFKFRLLVINRYNFIQYIKIKT
jgi:hypothetical protein